MVPETDFWMPVISGPGNDKDLAVHQWRSGLG